MSAKYLHAALMAGASLGALMLGSAAFAQAPAPAAPAAGAGTGLSEVVVTATRQASSVNRVSLSIAAATQQTLDRQGIKDAQDISRVVPGLTIPPPGGGGSTAGTNGVGIFTVRGIYSAAGAATTGVYLDDTSLTRRNNTGVSQNNGAPLPILFDLDRVEVLKGPQGTLYGGSSEGGTVRFISPTPSLTTYSGSARIEGKTVDMGGWGGEAGVAVGGPIVQDKLGFRMSGLWRRNPGYIDAYSPYTGQKVASDVNGEDQSMFRAAARWQATPDFTVDASYYTSMDRTQSQLVAPTAVYSKTANGVKASPTETFTSPGACIDQRSKATYLAFIPGPINSQGTAVPQTPIYCDTPLPPNGAGLGPTPAQYRFQQPTLTYGPFKQGPDVAYLTGQQELSGRATNLQVANVALSYNFHDINVKSVTSFIHDTTYSEGSGGEDQTQHQTIVGSPGYNPAGPPGVNPLNVPGTPSMGNANVVGFPLWGAYPDYPGHFVAHSQRDGLEEEFRISSIDPTDRLQWVAGAYIEQQRVTNNYRYPDDHFDASLASFWGPAINVVTRYGVDKWDGTSDTSLNANLFDTNYSGFAEGNFYVLHNLKVTAGVRVSALNFNFRTIDAGPFASRYPTSVTGSAIGKESDMPVTPKFGVTYEFTKADLVYFTAAKGFRSGGVNSAVSPTVCAPGLALYGITANQAPLTYAPDTVWSYEAGGKFRLLDNRMQLNGAVYRIDWSGIQSAITLTCGQGFVENGKKAVSQGVDFQGQYRVIDPLTLSFSVGYDDAHYVDAVSGPLGPGHGPIAINAGDPFPVAPWQISASADYETRVLDKYDSYLRLDYQWSSGYHTPGSFGVASWNPYTRDVGAVDNVSARLGVRFATWDFNVFSNNLLDRLEKLGNAGNGISQCIATNLACTNSSGVNGSPAYGNFSPFVSQLYTRPREIGIQANYKF